MQHPTHHMHPLLYLHHAASLYGTAPMPPCDPLPVHTYTYRHVPTYITLHPLPCLAPPHARLTFRLEEQLAKTTLAVESGHSSRAQGSKHSRSPSPSPEFWG